MDPLALVVNWAVWSFRETPTGADRGGPEIPHGRRVPWGSEGFRDVEVGV